MHRSFGRIAALLGAGALALAVVTPAFAAGPAKLTAVVAVDSTETPAAGKAWVRVLHGSPDAPAVDVKANGANILTNVPFGVISDYLPVDAGTYNIKVCAAGTDTCVINADLTFAAGKKYTVAATDLVASIDAQVIEDTAAPNAQQAQVRVVHFSADTPAVDVLTQDGSAKVVENLSYPNATGYLALAAGTYDLKVCAAADNTVCPLDPAPLALSAGTAYSVFAIGSLQATLATPAPTAAPTAAPVVTPPPTDTLGSTQEGSANGSLLAVLGILAIAGIGSLAMTRRLATRRVEK
jgi:Domain of unknown function (DUF4397)